MSGTIETVKDLGGMLATCDPQASLRVVVDGQALAPGFHVTEISRAEVASIDCGGRQLAWTEASIQILDSGVGRPMKIGTLRGILAKAKNTLPGLEEGPLVIDADPGGAGLRRYSITDVRSDDGAVTLSLAPKHAACKPIAEAALAGLPNCRSVGCCA